MYNLYSSPAGSQHNKHGSEGERFLWLRQVLLRKKPTAFRTMPVAAPSTQSRGARIRTARNTEGCPSAARAGHAPCIEG
jgi:hypothetical protein